MNEQNKKGQISILALIGSAAAILTPILGYIVYQQNGTDKDIKNHESRISVVEVRVERIPYLEAKIDALLEKQGVKFDEKIKR